MGNLYDFMHPVDLKEKIHIHICQDVMPYKSQVKNFSFLENIE